MKRKPKGAKPFKTIEQQNRERANQWRKLLKGVQEWALYLQAITDVPDVSRAEAIMHAHQTVLDLETEISGLTPKPLPERSSFTDLLRDN